MVEPWKKRLLGNESKLWKAFPLYKAFVLWKSTLKLWAVCAHSSRLALSMKRTLDDFQSNLLENTLYFSPNISVYFFYYFRSKWLTDIVFSFFLPNPFYDSLLTTWTRLHDGSVLIYVDTSYFSLLLISFASFNIYCHRYYYCS